MEEVAAAYERLIDKFTRWAQTEDNIRAAVVIGSRARVDHPADEWSDLDVLILANDPESYWVTTPYSPPTESEFLNLANDFWYHTVWTGKHLRRGELWWAKSCCDIYLKHLLRQMMEWHTRASRGEGVDTWMRGRFLEEWADARAVESLPLVFAHYDEEDVWRALMATMELFGWLAVETADSLGYSYPFFGEECATEFVQRLSSGRKHPVEVRS